MSEADVQAFVELEKKRMREVGLKLRSDLIDFIAKLDAQLGVEPLPGVPIDPGTAHSMVNAAIFGLPPEEAPKLHVFIDTAARNATEIGRLNRRIEELELFHGVVCGCGVTYHGQQPTCSFCRERMLDELKAKNEMLELEVEIHVAQDKLLEAIHNKLSLTDKHAIQLAEIQVQDAVAAVRVLKEKRKSNADNEG